jgi:hypothetical protein
LKVKTKYEHSIFSLNAGLEGIGCNSHVVFDRHRAFSTKRPYLKKQSQFTKCPNGININNNKVLWQFQKSDASQKQTQSGVAFGYAGRVYNGRIQACLERSRGNTEFRKNEKQSQFWQSPNLYKLFNNK